ncbi:hypothetical protein B0H67DRAFT_498566 [Lasiosphaeris hirsuta]|uniref:EamA domain-containing protein n=1 Tax=Lasiosphaeris hirsuta TaxID=260670 RepID=A0AA39ZWY4_9PEZI|nr:hypothetical protein B0H67DRAFT_498566 [Lasiosphaeris hirsuta]
MPHDGNATFIEVPQTPRSKRRLDDSNDEDTVDRLPLMEDTGYQKMADSSLLEPGGLRSLAGSPFSARGRLSPAHMRAFSPAPPEYQEKPWKLSLSQAWGRFWGRNRGVILVASAQLFGALMNMSARLLELEGDGMHPFQILFARMSITTMLSCMYMYYTKVPHFPFGPKGVRILLAARGVTGFFGIFGLWMSMMYLSLAEATVISFLAPCVAGYICHLILKDPFTRKEQMASFIALGGVVLIARPTSLFGGSESESTTGPVEAPGNVTQTMPHLGDEPTPAERLWAIGLALIGVLGASGAYTFIRWIGKRAHPLISVTYFSVWCTIVSTTVLLAAPLLDIWPNVRFGLPASLYQWALLLSLGLCGFIMQFMLTSGLGGEKSNRATAMVYTHMLFAAGFDKWIFGHEMGVVSLIGCGMIVGSALWAVLSKKQAEQKPNADVEMSATALRVEEGVPMLGSLGEGEDEEDEEDIQLEMVR